MQSLATFIAINADADVSVFYWAGNLVVFGFVIWTFVRSIRLSMKGFQDSSVEQAFSALRIDLPARLGGAAFVLCLIMTVICIRKGLMICATTNSVGLLAASLASTIFYLLPGSFIWLTGIVLSIIWLERAGRIQQEVPYC
jgi:hypothetical protein